MPWEVTDREKPPPLLRPAPPRQGLCAASPGRGAGRRESLQVARAPLHLRAPAGPAWCSDPEATPLGFRCPPGEGRPPVRSPSPDTHPRPVSTARRADGGSQVSRGTSACVRDWLTWF